MAKKNSLLIKLILLLHNNGNLLDFINDKFDPKSLEIFNRVVKITTLFLNCNVDVINCKKSLQISIPKCSVFLTKSLSLLLRWVTHLSIRLNFPLISGEVLVTRLTAEFFTTHQTWYRLSNLDNYSSAKILNCFCKLLHLVYIISLWSVVCTWNLSRIQKHFYLLSTYQR